MCSGEGQCDVSSVCPGENLSCGFSRWGAGEICELWGQSLFLGASLCHGQSPCSVVRVCVFGE